MYSVSVSKIAVTANIVQYNGSLCSGEVISYTKTYSKGICAIGSNSRRTLNDRVFDYASNVMQSAVTLGKRFLPFGETDAGEGDGDAVPLSSNPFTFDEVDDVYPISPYAISPMISAPTTASMATEATTETVTEATIPHRNLRGVDFSLATVGKSKSYLRSRVGSAVAKTAAVNPNTRIQTAAFSTSLPGSVNGVYTK